MSSADQHAPNVYNVPVHTRNTQHLLPPNFVPSAKDIVCGRARENFHHEGNRYFRDLINNSIGRYLQANTKLEKTAAIASIVDLVQQNSPDGGFVKKDPASGRYFRITDAEARDKVGHAIRKAVQRLQDTKPKMLNKLQKEKSPASKPKARITKAAAARKEKKRKTRTTTEKRYPDSNRHSTIAPRRPGKPDSQLIECSSAIEGHGFHNKAARELKWRATSTCQSKKDDIDETFEQAHPDSALQATFPTVLPPVNSANAPGTGRQDHPDLSSETSRRSSARHYPSEQHARATSFQQNSQSIGHNQLQSAPLQMHLQLQQQQQQQQQQMNGHGAMQHHPLAASMPFASVGGDLRNTFGFQDGVMQSALLQQSQLEMHHRFMSIPGSVPPAGLATPNNAVTGNRWQASLPLYTNTLPAVHMQHPHHHYFLFQHQVQQNAAMGNQLSPIPPYGFHQYQAPPSLTQNVNSASLAPSSLLRRHDIQHTSQRKEQSDLQQQREQHKSTVSQNRKQQPR